MSLARALVTGDLAELPSRRQEDWRWTDLAGLIRAVPSPSPEASASADPALEALGVPIQLFVNGRALGPAGEGALIVRRFVSQAEGTAHHVEASLSIPPGARLTLIDRFEGHGSAYVADVATPITVSEGAQVERLVLIDDATDAVSVTLSEVSLASGARFSQTVLASGAKRQRFETRVAHPGGGAAVRLDGAYVLAGPRHSDQTTVVTHQGPDGETDQLVKGVVRDQARGVFQGRIVVERGADRTDARMGHHGLILSDRAEIDAKPELLIYADDVACAHGATIGALDEATLFYAAQRGIPEAEARALLTAAFVGEVVDRIEHDAARELARAWVEERLHGL